MKANELKVTDLMVGDWVMSFGAPHKVVGIRTDMFEPHIRTDMSDTWYEEGIENLLEPIQLTPEILEKNGLANDPYGCHFEEDEYMDLEISAEEEGDNGYVLMHPDMVSCLRAAIRKGVELL